MYYGNPFVSETIPPVSKVLLIGCIAVYLLQLILDTLTNNMFSVFLSLSVMGIKKLYLWQLITYQFLHGSPFHLLMNLIGLFFFGPEVERYISSRRFLILYIACGVIGGVGWLVLSAGDNAFCLGASGAIYGVLGAFAALFPERYVTFLLFFVIPITMKVKTLAIGLAIFSLLATAGSPGQIAYAAHLVGGLAGYFYIKFFFYSSTATSFSLNPIKWAKDVLWWWHRRKFKVIDRTSHFEEDDDNYDYEPSQEEVDAILDKIAKWGIGSLTRKERQILERASRKRRF